MKKAIAVMLIVLLVLTAAACQGGETTSSQAAPQSTESSQTERSTEGTTEAPTTTETPTTEAPTTTEVPTTEAPTTEAPTTEAPVQPVFRTGLYELKDSWDERPMNKIGSATYYFSDAGQFCCEVSYKDASGSVNTDQVGNYVADGETLTVTEVEGT